MNQKDLEIIKETIRVFSKPSSDPRQGFRKEENRRNRAFVKELKAYLEQYNKP